MTGPKRIKSRTNTRTKVRNVRETRGGAHVKVTRTPKQKATAIAECREELIQRLKDVTADPSVLGQHWVDSWVTMIREPGRLLSTTSGTKLIANLTDMIFCGAPPPPMPRPWASKPTGEPEDSKNGEDLGQSGLPPLKPDPAKCAIKLPPLKPDYAAQKVVPPKPDNE